MRFLLWTALVWIGMPLCAAGPGTVQQAAQRFEEICSKVPAPLGSQFRFLAVRGLKARHPELAQKLMPATEKLPPAPREEPAVSPAEVAIYQQFGRFGQVSTDPERAKLLIDLASQVRALPPGATKLLLAWNLRGEVTEGDMGPEAMTVVAETLAESIKGAPPNAGIYLDLASLIHYEGVRPPMEEPALDAALALLELRESLAQESPFALTALDGRVYSRVALRGKIVLVNFWATSCMPCRKEMPDLEKLYREYGDKGLVVLAISTEERAVVAKFIAEKGYSFPVLLDPGGKASADFDVEGIPRSFLFDRQGRLVGEALDSRSESQFRSMVKAAGLE